MRWWAESYFLSSRLRQRRKRLAFCLSDLGFVSPPIGQALAHYALEQFPRASEIIDAKC
jgi:hypothetical protein